MNFLEALVKNEILIEESQGNSAVAVRGNTFASLRFDNRKVMIRHLVTDPEMRGQGSGGRLMMDILRAADAAELPVILHPVPIDMEEIGTPWEYDRATAGLERFYARLGFKGDGYLLTREPGTTPTSWMMSVLAREATDDESLLVAMGEYGAELDMLGDGTAIARLADGDFIVAQGELTPAEQNEDTPFPE